VEIELNAGRRSSVGPVPLDSAAKRMVAPRQFQSNVDVVMPVRSWHSD
jgi:hypothetical protein